MTRVIHAIYEDGVLKPLETLDLKDRQQVEITVRSLVEPGSSGEETAPPADPLEGLRVATGIPDLAAQFDDYRFGRREP